MCNSVVVVLVAVAIVARWWFEARPRSMMLCSDSIARMLKLAIITLNYQLDSCRRLSSSSVLCVVSLCRFLLD